MKLNKKTEYAIHILVDLASHPRGEPVLTREIAFRCSIPQNYIAQILMELRELGWTEGIRGAGGGVMLRVDPAGISVRDVVEAMEGPTAITQCLAEASFCENQSSCPLHGLLVKAQGEMLKVLEDMSIAELAEEKTKLR